ncbi:hypothetical protein D3C71_1418140 [compost metagenome]
MFRSFSSRLRHDWADGHGLSKHRRTNSTLDVAGSTQQNAIRGCILPTSKASRLTAAMPHGVASIWISASRSMINVRHGLR